VTSTRVISKQLPKNMDKEPGEWEKHEMDRELLKQLDHLFNANNFLPTAEKRKERVQKAISDLPEWDPDTEEKRQQFLEIIQTIERIQKDNQVKPLDLKVVSAITMCQKFKDSEEILSLGPSAMIRWRGICREDCEADGEIYCEFCRSRVAPGSQGCPHSDLHCGFCRFSMWIKEQPLPKELKVFCKNVLHFLGENWFCGFGGRYYAGPHVAEEEDNEEQHQEEDI